MKKHLLILCYGLALTAFTAYISLDTFVLSTPYKKDTTEMNYQMFDEQKAQSTGNQEQAEEVFRTAPVTEPVSQPSDREIQPPPEATEEITAEAVTTTAAEEVAEPETTETEATEQDIAYQDENITIAMKEYYMYDTRIYVADVQLSSAEYLKTAFADDTCGKNVTAKTSVTASENNAILAVNGDYYGARERGYVIRNGIVYRDTPSDDDLLCIYADGTMKVISQSSFTAQELIDQGVWQAFAFGPGLVSDGEITVSENDEVGRAMASNPRTAIGMLSENHFLFVVSDGRTSESAGLSLYQLAEFMKSLGAETAYNLDGGGSSTMYFGGEVINNPTNNGKIKERSVSDIVYIG